MKSTSNKKNNWGIILKKVHFRKLYLIIIIATLGIAIKSFREIYDGTAGPTMTTQTWPAGTFLANFPEGDRINTYHRNYLMINGQAGTGVWDVSNPTTPKRVQFSDDANNGHRWWKLGGDLFYREYSVPELQGTGYKYLDLSNMLDRKPVTSSDILFTVEDGQSNFDNLETFPHTIDGSRVFDMRTGEQLDNIPATVSLPDIVVRVGNYVFYTPQTGDISVFDFGDPRNIKFLGSFGGDIPHEQYSTGIQLWRNYLVFMSGNQGPDALVGFDISDPTDVKRGFSLHSDQITLGRYMIFQDEYGFTGRFDRGVKFNFEKMEIEQEFIPPSSDETLQFIDNQWMPIGHILVASGDDKTSIFAHQDGLDTKPPTIGHHFPVAGAINQPQTTTLGFVINETLDDLTINDQTIQVSPLGGVPIKGDITTTSYQVINYAPQQALLPNTTYEVKFIEGGIKDAVGNGMEEYIFYFTTGGDTSNQSPEITGIDLSTPSPVALNTEIDFTANATDVDGNELNYRWDFGDGSPRTGAIGATTSHTYTESGNYLVQVQISDNNGGFVVGSQSVVVVSNISLDLPTQSSPIAIDETNRVVWTVNPDNNTVTMVDADNLSVIREVAVGKDPVSVALDSSGKAWVTCRDSDEVYVLKSNGSLETRIAFSLGSRPYGIVFTPDGSRGFVSAFGSGEIIEVSPLTSSIRRKITIGPTPRALAITSDGSKLLVTRFISPDEEGQVWEVNLNTFTLNNTIPLALDDFTVDNGNEGRGLPNYVAGIAIHPDNTSAWSVAKKDNILRGLARDGKPLAFDNVVRTAISPINLGTSSEELARRLDIDNHGQPSSVLYSPTGNYLFVTMQGNNRIVVIDPKRGLELLKKDVGRAPQGLAIDSSTNTIFVKNFMDRSITVFDASEIINRGSNTLEELSTITTVSSEELTPTVLKGKQLFYDASDLRMGTDGYISCVSCHSDGTQDGRTWDFTDRGEGLRNTISLVGREGTAHGRVHWSANFDEIQDFENDIRGHFNGQGFMSDADFNEGTTALSLGDPKTGKSVDLDALAAYVESLNTFDPSPYRNDNGTLTTAGAAGKLLFEDLKCNSCHGGSNFTDSSTGKMHDVGTIVDNSGQRLGTNLLALDWATAPYLHNGSAKTLAEVFTRFNANNSHGKTSRLSSTQITQLESYLKQIDGSELVAESSQVLEMTSPQDGATIDTADPVKLSVNTNIDGVTKIEYYVDSVLIEEVTTPPFESSWNPILWKSYTISAKVFYNNGNTASVTPEVNVRYKNTIKAMFVVGDKENLGTEDQRIKSRLEQKLGFEITLFSDEEATSPQLANPFDMALISSSVDPRVLGNDLEAARVPLLTWNPFMYGRLRLISGELNIGFGFTTNGFSSISVTNPTHPMAAGVGTNTALYSIIQSLPFGNPTEEAIIIAKAGDQPILFGYEASIDIPSRRVAFPLRNQFMHLLTEDGLKMFDAAVIWTLHGGDVDTPIGPLPDVFFTTPLEGNMVNTPLKINFETEGWELPSLQYKLRFRIDGQDRGLISSEGEFIDPTTLSEGPHQLTLQMERSDNSLTDLGETITINVTNDPLPQDPTAIIQSPTDGALVGADFEIEFSTFDWEVTPGGQHVKYFIDGVEKGALFEIAPISVTNLLEGEHTVGLVLANADGTIAGDPTEITITVDERFGSLPSTSFSVNYRDNSSSASAVELKPVFQIENTGNESVNLSEFKIRYWFTPENNVPMVFNLDYSAVEDASGGFETTGTHNYLEIGFETSSGVLAPNNKTGEIQTRLHHSGFQGHNQSNDFSYDAGKRGLSPHVLVTLYRNEVLVWGLEPTGSLVSTNQRPTANISTNVVSGVAPLMITFDASGSSDPEGGTLSYRWDFGNGDVATGATVGYNFEDLGIQNVTLTVSDDSGASDTTSTSIEVLGQTILLESNFTATPISGTVPLVASFDSSVSVFPSGSTINYVWDFGDGTTSDLANPSHTYSQSGSYAVTLTINDGVNSDVSNVETITANRPSTVPSVVEASFTADNTSGVIPVTIGFDASASTSSVSSIVSYLWDFGDTTTETGVTTSHRYNTAGVYTVILTVEDSSGVTDIATQIITVTDPILPNPGGGAITSCSFGAPQDSPLRSFVNKSFTNAHVLGSDGPDLSNVTNFTINWNLANNGLYQLSINTNNGSPSWWIDLKESVTVENLNEAQPSITFSGTGIQSLDGAYNATVDDGNLVLVSNEGFTIYFSNSTTVPNCGNSAGSNKEIGIKRETIKVYPNPIVDYLTIQSDQNLEGAVIKLIDISGKIVIVQTVQDNLQQKEIDVSTLGAGVYFVQIQKGRKTIVKKVIK